MSKRYVCVHGHFYQPPRENPWLEAIELQESAHPFHDWNERIALECYGPNSSSRILDEHGDIAQIVNNYSRISFNFGATLLSWLEEFRPDIYSAILRADKLGRASFSGHGPALAQVYNHIIMPLANKRDQITQVVWGIRDFERRFERMPEGMWLAETAVDIDTLEVLAEHGIRFTILAPHQAARVRQAGHADWRDVHDATLDITRPYRQQLPSGRSIDIFFYQGPISRSIAFEHLLERGEALAHRLVSEFKNTHEAQLMHIATDGETYGHHHRYGEMALSYALEYMEREGLADITIYGEYLDLHPPSWEVEIHSNTSWSCAHGIERWRSDCGCHTGGRPGWTQRWRAPLRGALDWLRDQLAGVFEEHSRGIFEDPWAARDAYVEVILDRSHQNTDKFLRRHMLIEPDGLARQRALSLLEMQRHTQLMYTSCGWFFNDLAGIETIQILQYAGRAIQLASSLTMQDLEEGFLARLEDARSNIPEEGSGRDLYEAHVRPAKVDLKKVCAHYAIHSLFKHAGEYIKIYCYEVDTIRQHVHDAGAARMALGRAKVTSMITGEAEIFEYGVLHMGDHNVDGGIREVRPDHQVEELYAEVVAAFRRAEFPALIRLLDKHFGEEVFTLRSVFKDEQRSVVDHITAAAQRDAVAVYRQLYNRRATLMAFLNDLGTSLPESLQIAARVSLQCELEQLFELEDTPRGDVYALLKEAENVGVTFDEHELAITAQAKLTKALARWGAHASDTARLESVRKIVDLIERLPFEVSLWEAQNMFFSILEDELTLKRLRALGGDPDALEWIAAFEELGEHLHISKGVLAAPAQ